MVLSTAGPSIPILAHRERPATAAPLGPQSPHGRAHEPKPRRAESARARATSPTVAQRGLRAHELVETCGDDLVAPLPERPPPSSTPTISSGLRLDVETTELLSAFDGRQRVEAAAANMATEMRYEGSPRRQQAASAGVHAVGGGSSSSGAADPLAPRLISLVGVTPHGAHHQHCLGLFELRKEAVNGRASYAQSGTAMGPSESRILLWWSNGWWVVGEARYLGSKNGCVIAAADRDAMRPDDVRRGSWKAVLRAEGEGGGSVSGSVGTSRGVGRWVDAAELVCMSGFLV